MNPFDMPPSGAPAPLPAPESASPVRRRGRMALVALLAAGLVGGGIAGVSQFVSAGEPELAATAPDESDDSGEPSDTLPPADDESSDEELEPADPEPSSDGADVDGEIVIELDGEEPVVLDLGEIEGDITRLTECIGLPALDFDFDLEGDFGDLESGVFDLEEIFGDEFFEQLPPLDELFGEFGDLGDLEGDFGDFGGSVTVTGPDGVSVVDLGENGSVTITKDGDDITIDATGDADVQQLDELFDDFGLALDGELFGDELFGDEFFDEFGTLFDQFDEGAFDEFLEGLPSFDEIPELESIDPDAVESCVADILGD